MKILLVEDDSSIRNIALLSLARIGNHEVDTAENGIEALEKIEAKTYELILLDVMMPDLDGFETCRLIKERLVKKNVSPNIPIIFLTAKAQAYEQQHGISLGAIGYIIKPFDPMILAQQIEDILKKHEHDLSEATEESGDDTKKKRLRSQNLKAV